jgi:hypothetical protein
VVAEISSCRRDFLALRDRTVELGRSLHVACPAPDSMKGLEDVTALLDEIAEAEIRQARSEEVRQRSLSVLDRVLSLAHVADEDYSPLGSCQEQARALHGALSTSSWNALPPEAEPLAERHHALAHLVTLIEDREELSDDVWDKLYESVTAAFGKPLAIAAARARLTLPLEPAGAASEEK